jgi:hypothetical protein
LSQLQDFEDPPRRLEPTMTSTVKAHISKRPAGLTGIVASLLVVVAAKLGVHVTQEVAALIVAAAVAIASALWPRFAQLEKQAADAVTKALDA